MVRLDPGATSGVCRGALNAKEQAVGLSAHLVATGTPEIQGPGDHNPDQADHGEHGKHAVPARSDQTQYSDNDKTGRINKSERHGLFP